MTETQLRMIWAKKKCIGSYSQVNPGVYLASGMAGSRGLLMSRQHILSIYVIFPLCWLRPQVENTMATSSSINLANPMKNKCLFPHSCYKTSKGESPCPSWDPCLPLKSGWVRGDPLKGKRHYQEKEPWTLGRESWQMAIAFLHIPRGWWYRSFLPPATSIGARP